MFQCPTSVLVSVVAHILAPMRKTAVSAFGVKLARHVLEIYIL